MRIEPGTHKSDAQIQQEVLAELRGDTRVRETEVGVEVEQGIVTLTGTVNSLGKRTAAVEAAHRVKGVLDVANDLRIHVAGQGAKTDAEIAAAVRHALVWDVFVPDQRIRSTVTDGLVTLEGAVDHLSERSDAERAVRNLLAVRGVINRISVETPLLGLDVRQSITEALERHAIREANRLSIQVEEEGLVTLSGTVDSWAERAAVLAAISGLQGVRFVRDGLQVL